MSPTTPPVSEPLDGRDEPPDSVDARRRVLASLDALIAPLVASAPEVSAP